MSINPNTLVDALISLADTVDPEYSEACLDSCNTNAAPVDDHQRFVAELHAAALLINASGLCDLADGGDFVRFQPYRDNLR